MWWLPEMKCKFINGAFSQMKQYRRQYWRISRSAFWNMKKSQVGAIWNCQMNNPLIWSAYLTISCASVALGGVKPLNSHECWRRKTFQKSPGSLGGHTVIYLGKVLWNWFGWFWVFTISILWAVSSVVFFLTARITHGLVWFGFLTREKHENSIGLQKDSQYL